MVGGVLVPSQKIGAGGTSIHQIPPESAEEHESLLVPSHPLRIKPAGNAYTATENIKLAAGSFTLLPDELLIQVLESLDATSLNRLGSACKSLYAFSRLEDLWKKFCIEYETSPAPCFSISLKFFVGCALPLPSSGRRFQHKSRRVQGVDYLSQDNVYIIKSH